MHKRKKRSISCTGGPILLRFSRAVGYSFNQVRQGRRTEATGRALLAERAKGTRPGRLTVAVPAELRDWSGQLRRSAAGGAESRGTVNINIHLRLRTDGNVRRHADRIHNPSRLPVYKQKY